MLESKKWKAALVATGVGLVVFFVSTYFEMPPDVAIKWLGVIIAPILFYIPSQGLADIGKERAWVEKIELKNGHPIFYEEGAKEQGK